MLPRQLLSGPGDVVEVMIGAGRWRCCDSADVAFGVAGHVESDIRHIFPVRLIYLLLNVEINVLHYRLELLSPSSF